MWFPRAKSYKNCGPEATSIFHQCTIQAHHKKLTVEVQSAPGSCLPQNATQRSDTVMFSVWSVAMELQDNKPHSCMCWLVIPFHSQKSRMSPLDTSECHRPEKRAKSSIFKWTKITNPRELYKHYRINTFYPLSLNLK